LSCDGLCIVHYSAPYWISGDGQLHTGHEIEFPREWLPT
jgi:hypothetical protein